MAIKPKSSPVAAKKATTKAKAPTKAKKAPERVLVSQRTVATAPKNQEFAMPQEVKDWIDRAQSIMNHQRSQIETLKAENKKLQDWRRWAENRILRSDHE